MELMGAISRLAGFFRADYPGGLSGIAYVPLFALMGRRVSEDEVGVEPSVDVWR